MTNGSFTPRLDRRRAIGLALAGLGAAVGPAAAQGSFPSRTIRLVVPFPPGGSSDLLGRLVAAQLSQRLGQPVVVDNRAGAGGTLGMQHVAREPADGYTIAQGAIASLAFSPLLMNPPPYDPNTVLTPVAFVGSDYNALFINARIPARNMAELEAWIRAQPNPVPYASAGIGTPAHLGIATFAQGRNLPMTHVPYRGAAPAIQDVAAGNAAMIFTGAVAGRGLVEGGQLRMLAVSARSRMADFPDVPTVREAGVPEMELLVWYGYFLHPATPRPILQRYHAAFMQMLGDAAFVAELRRGMMEPFPADQRLEDAPRLVAESVADVRRRIEAAGVKPE
ncbi:Bug family tripartite tricarboxylate transporter substrate binding protein [Falsiroseomonas ponticola]|uniref:Bug family tripartite tricarboxylate transporter substrate binding protein n=1 Tax=Falsiroseomonas ponticola TaxID=2786951 RepID=UPI001933D227|nr:tripartite tricarboxylate transporter substrate binding protein [Roseomonas ponticola]